MGPAPASPLDGDKPNNNATTDATTVSAPGGDGPPETDATTVTATGGELERLAATSGSDMTAVAAAAIAQGYSAEEVANWQKQWEQWHQWHVEYAAQASDASGAPYARTEDGDFDSETQYNLALRQQQAQHAHETQARDAAAAARTAAGQDGGTGAAYTSVYQQASYYQAQAAYYREQAAGNAGFAGALLPGATIPSDGEVSADDDDDAPPPLPATTAAEKKKKAKKAKKSKTPAPQPAGIPSGLPATTSGGDDDDGAPPLLNADGSAPPMKRARWGATHAIHEHFTDGFPALAERFVRKRASAAQRRYEYNLGSCRFADAARADDGLRKLKTLFRALDAACESAATLAVCGAERRHAFSEELKRWGWRRGARLQYRVPKDSEDANAVNVEDSALLSEVDNSQLPPKKRKANAPETATGLPSAAFA